MNNHNRIFISGVYNGIMQDFLVWVLENPTPANILLISSDDSFSSFFMNFLCEGSTSFFLHLQGLMHPSPPLPIYFGIGRHSFLVGDPLTLFNGYPSKSKP